MQRESLYSEIPELNTGRFAPLVAVLLKLEIDKGKNLTPTLAAWPYGFETDFVRNPLFGSVSFRFIPKYILHSF